MKIYFYEKWFIRTLYSHDFYLVNIIDNYVILHIDFFPLNLSSRLSYNTSRWSIYQSDTGLVILTHLRPKFLLYRNQSIDI